MEKDNLIELEPRARLLEKARLYVNSPESFLAERDQATSLLLRAMKYADGELKLEIMLLMGAWAKEQIAWPLYAILSNPLEKENVRRDAAVQLSAIGPFLKDPQPLVERLLQDMESSDTELRLHATFAAGWEGNFRASIPLIQRLYDPDDQVQQTAVNALSNLRDDRILSLLLERMEHGPPAQKRAILFNLWRFYSRQDEVIEVYRRYLGHEDPDIRFDALVLFGLVTKVGENLTVYRKCLGDPDPRLRELALKRLGEEGGEVLGGLKEEIAALLEDPQMKVKRAALEIYRKISSP